MKDRDRIKRKMPLEDINKKELIFRKRFDEGKDAEIAKILWNYFNAVEQKWPKAWHDFRRGMILARTTGFAAFMRALPYIFSKVRQKEGIPKQENFYQILDGSTLRDDQFTVESFQPGSSGESALLNRLISDLQQ